MSRKDERTRRLNFGEDNDGREAEHEDTRSKRHRSTKQRTYTAEEIERGRKVYREVLNWCETYPDAWRYMNIRFVELGKQGRRNNNAKFAIQHILEDVREREEAFTSTSGGKLNGVSHNHRSVFARLLCERHPEYRDLIRTQETVFDWIQKEREESRRHE